MRTTSRKECRIIYVGTVYDEGEQRGGIELGLQKKPPLCRVCSCNIDFDKPPFITLDTGEAYLPSDVDEETYEKILNGIPLDYSREIIDSAMQEDSLNVEKTDEFEDAFSNCEVDRSNSKKIQGVIDIHCVSKKSM